MVARTDGSTISCFASCASGQEETVPAVGLFLMIGAHPHTDWLPAEVNRDPRGFVLTGGGSPDARVAARAEPLSGSRRACPACSPPATPATDR